MSGVAYKAGHTKKNILIAIVNQKLSGLDEGGAFRSKGTILASTDSNSMLSKHIITLS